MNEFGGSGGRDFGAMPSRDAAPLGGAPDGAASEGASPAAGEGAERKLKLRPLLALWPYVARYPVHIAGACAALVVASLATLAVPVAVRRMIDFGFSTERIGLIDQYFAVMILVVGVLAGASALR